MDKNEYELSIIWNWKIKRQVNWNFLMHRIIKWYFCFKRFFYKLKLWPFLIQN